MTGHLADVSRKNIQFNSIQFKKTLKHVLLEMFFSTYSKCGNLFGLFCLSNSTVVTSYKCTCLIGGVSKCTDLGPCWWHF